MGTTLAVGDREEATDPDPASAAFAEGGYCIGREAESVNCQQLECRRLGTCMYSIAQARCRFDGPRGPGRLIAGSEAKGEAVWPAIGCVSMVIRLGVL